MIDCLPIIKSGRAARVLQIGAVNGGHEEGNRGSERPGSPESSLGRYFYDPEISDARVVGTVALRPTGYWWGELTASRFEHGVSRVTIRRFGTHLRPPIEVDEQRVELIVPLAELDAFEMLVRGLIAHARRDAGIQTADQR